MASESGNEKGFVGPSAPTFNSLATTGIEEPWVMMDRESTSFMKTAPGSNARRDFWSSIDSFQLALSSHAASVEIRLFLVGYPG